VVYLVTNTTTRLLCRQTWNSPNNYFISIPRRIFLRRKLYYWQKKTLFHFKYKQKLHFTESN